jgi:hypothetical protein
MFKILSTFLVLALPLVRADFFTTSPVSDTTWTIGQPATIAYINGPSEPNLSAIQTATIFLCTGTDLNQQCDITLASNVPVQANGGTVSVASVPSVSPLGKVWFLKYTTNTGVSNWSTRFTVAGADGNTGGGNGTSTNNGTNTNGTTTNNTTTNNGTSNNGTSKNNTATSGVEVMDGHSWGILSTMVAVTAISLLG